LEGAFLGNFARVAEIAEALSMRMINAINRLVFRRRSSHAPYFKAIPAEPG
jgi:hypothetical protein